MEFKGRLHANKCVAGASYVLHRERRYRLGSKSLKEILNLVEGAGPKGLGKTVSNAGCENIYPLEFDGVFEKEASMTGYGNDEVKEVVQIFRYRLL